MIGQTISHYRILSKLGQGGMGEVYLAEDIRLGHKVAIKRLSQHLVGDHDHRQRFQREARAVAHLTHPNILTLLEFDEVEGDLILVTEYLSGGTVGDAIEEDPEGIDLPRFFRWATQMADGLAAAHSQQVLHRDLKPANFLLTDAGDLRIADFGLTQLAAETQITQPGAVMGTLAYMAPEQLRGERVDERADVFALGATYIEMFVGRHPDTGYRPMAHAVAETPPKEILAGRAELPAELIELVSGMLEQRPEDRIASAVEVADRLRDIAGQMGLQLSGAPSVAPPAKPRYRRWVAVLVILLLAGTLWLSRDRNPEGGQPIVDKPAVAVLPLRDVSPDSDQSRLAAGITEALLTELSRITSIAVISRRSSEQLAGSILTLPEIAEQLHADVVLDGSVTRMGERVRITATLVDGQEDRNLWVEDFEGEIQEIFALQRQIAMAVANGMGIEVDSIRSSGPSVSRAMASSTLELYLQARGLWKQRNAESLEESIGLYRKILETDPEFVEAWVGLAEALLVLPSYADISPREAYPEARSAAQEALELDPARAEAWNILSELACYNDFEYAESERLRLKSLELNPSSATTHQWYAEFLGGLGRHEEAMREIRIAQRLDPLSPLMQTVEGQILMYAHEFDEAIRVLEQVLTAHPDFVLARIYLARNLQHAGREAEAGEAFIEWRRLVGDDQEEIAELQSALESDGYLAIKHIRLERLLILLEEGATALPRSLVSAYAEQEDVENSLLWLERSYEDRDIGLLRLRVNVDFDFLRENPRFQEMMRRINLDG